MIRTISIALTLVAGTAAAGDPTELHWQALKASLDRLWELDIERVVPAHGDIFEEDAKQVIRGLCQRFYE